MKYFSSSLSLSLSLSLSVCVSPLTLTFKRKEEKRNYGGSFRVEAIDIDLILFPCVDCHAAVYPAGLLLLDVCKW